MVPARIPSVSVPHLRRCLEAGLIEQGKGGFVLTPLGERAMSEYAARNPHLNPRMG